MCAGPTTDVDVVDMFGLPPNKQARYMPLLELWTARKLVNLKMRVASFYARDGEVFSPSEIAVQRVKNNLQMH